MAKQRRFGFNNLRTRNFKSAQHFAHLLTKWVLWFPAGVPTKTEKARKMEAALSVLGTLWDIAEQFRAKQAEPACKQQLAV
jgi:hypothetical protein